MVNFEWVARQCADSSGVSQRTAAFFPLKGEVRTSNDQWCPQCGIELASAECRGCVVEQEWELWSTPQLGTEAGHLAFGSERDSPTCGRVVLFQKPAEVSLDEQSSSKGSSQPAS
jgi:hypothetical protein